MIYFSQSMPKSFISYWSDEKVETAFLWKKKKKPIRVGAQEFQHSINARSGGPQPHIDSLHRLIAQFV